MRRLKIALPLALLALPACATHTLWDVKADATTGDMAWRAAATPVAVGLDLATWPFQAVLGVRTWNERMRGGWGWRP